MTFKDAARIIKRGDAECLDRALVDGIDPNLTNQFGWSLLMLAALKGNTRMGRALFEAGAHINTSNNWGETALSLSAHKGYIKFTAWLLSVGASTDCRPHGLDMAAWIEMSSGLPHDRLTRVLNVIQQKGHMP